MPAFVQGNHGTISTGTTITVTQPGASVAGDCLVACFYAYPFTVSISSIHDNAGNVYQPVLSDDTSNPSVSAYIWFCPSIALPGAGNLAVTVVFNASVSFADLELAEFSGPGVDISLQAFPITGTSGTSINSPSLVTLLPNLLLINYAVAATGGPVTPGGSWTAVNPSSTQNIFYQVAATPGTYAANWTQVTSGSWGSYMIAIGPSSALVTVPSNGLAMTPPMGWDSWRLYGQTATQAQIQSQAAAMVTKGLLAAGYNLVNVNDTLYTSRSAGVLQLNVHFTSVATLAQFIQAQGLQFAAYLAPGPAGSGCGNFPTSQGFEAADAALLASLGVKYLMYDSCYTFSWDTLAQYAYQTMGQALQASGAPIIFLISCPGYDPNPSPNGQFIWAKRAGGNVVWTWADLGAMTWANLVTLVNAQIGLAPQVFPGRWNLPDFLGTGNGTLTDAEGRSCMCLWSILAAPLWAACDLTTASATTLATLTNPEVIAVDQDSSGICGTRVSHVVAGSAFADVWARQLSNGAWAIVLWNQDSASHTIAATWAMFGQFGPFTVRDILGHSTLGSMGAGVSAVVASHDVAMFLLTPISWGPLPDRKTLRNLIPAHPEETLSPQKVALKKQGSRLRQIAIHTQEEEESHLRGVANRSELRKLSKQKAESEAQAKAEAEEQGPRKLALAKISERLRAIALKRDAGR